MDDTILGLLRCPFCGTRLSLVQNEALVIAGGRIESGVLGCECCAFPVVAGIPVMLADDTTRAAMHLLEAGEREAALFMLLGLDAARGEAFRALFTRDAHATYREALALLSQDAEGTCFAYRLSDPTFVMIEALVRALGQHPGTLSGRCLDLCGGTGHLARVLFHLQPAGGVTVADLFFWKLWLGRRFIVPGCATVCCDANQPLPFAREAFSIVVLADAFPYIWQKRLLAQEMTRLSSADGAIVMPHLHSALGENFSAGDTLSPDAYRNLFAPGQPRLFSDERLFDEVVERGLIDLTHDAAPDELGAEASFTLIASSRPDVFRRYDVRAALELTGELRVNPLYRVERHGSSTILTLTFPTPEYEEEFGACRRYLPDTVTVEADLTGAIRPDMLGPRLDELRRRRIIIDAPPHYC